MPFRTLEQLLEFYFEATQGLPGSLDMSKFIDGNPTATKQGAPTWIDEISTIGYYFQALKYDTQFILGLCFYRRLGDQQIAEEINGCSKRRLWNAHKVKETREQATKHLDGVFREIKLIVKKFEYG